MKPIRRRPLHRFLTAARAAAHRNGINSDARIADILSNRQLNKGRFWQLHFGYPRAPRGDILKAAIAELRAGR